MGIGLQNIWLHVVLACALHACRNATFTGSCTDVLNTKIITLFDTKFARIYICHLDLLLTVCGRCRMVKKCGCYYVLSVTIIGTGCTGDPVVTAALSWTPDIVSTHLWCPVWKGRCVQHGTLGTVNLVACRQSR